METLVQDLRYALRALLKAPGFTIVAALTLALGIGANTAIFSVLYGVLLRPLPYPDPDRLVTLYGSYRDEHGELTVTYREFQFVREQGRVFEHVAATTSVGMNLFAGSRADRVRGLRVSADYFRVLGARPALGRDFTAEEDVPGGPNALILSHGLWRRRFAGDSTVIGRLVSVDGAPYTVVGVMPADFGSLEPVEAWSTIAQVGRTIGGGQNVHIVARIAAPLSFRAAQAGFAPTARAFTTEFGQWLPRGVEIGLYPLRQVVVADVNAPVRILFGAIGLVLLIACANVANLALGRVATRTRELAVRVAVGATRGRLMRQLLTENLALAVLGGALGAALGEWGLRLLLAFAPESLPRTGEIRLDAWALGFTIAISLVTGLLVGLAPAWHAARSNLHDALKENAGRATGTSRQGRLRGTLVVGEVAVSIVLLVGAGLLIRTVANLVRTDPGFDAHHVIGAEIWLTGSRYDSTAKVAAFYASLSERVRALPGVLAAAVVEAGEPLERGGNMPVAVDGGPQGFVSIEYRTVSPGYFATLEIPVRTGRVLESGDREGAEPVAVVNAAFGRRYFEGRDAIGHTVAVGRNDPPRRIVGVVADVRSFIGFPASPTVFIPSAQTPIGMTRIFSSWFPIHVLARVPGDPASLRGALERTIREADAEVPVGRVRTMDEVLSQSVDFQRFVMFLLSVFAGLAVALAAIGLYGVLSYLVAQRTHEIGVRMALGALPREVLGLVVSRGMLLAGIGVIVGLGGALALTRLLASQLYGVKPTDPVTMGAVTVFLLLVALVACLVPARRATRVDPLVALRSE